MNFGEKPFNGTEVVNEKLWLTLLRLGHCGIKLVAYFGGLLVTNLNYGVGPTKTDAYFGLI